MSHKNLGCYRMALPEKASCSGLAPTREGDSEWREGEREGESGGRGRREGEGRGARRCLRALSAMMESGHHEGEHWEERLGE